MCIYRPIYSLFWEHIIMRQCLILCIKTWLCIEIWMRFMYWPKSKPRRFCGWISDVWCLVMCMLTYVFIVDVNISQQRESISVIIALHGVRVLWLSAPICLQNGRQPAVISGLWAAHRCVFDSTREVLLMNCWILSIHFLYVQSLTAILRKTQCSSNLY